MPTYSYTSLSKQGKQQQGIVEATNLKQAKENIRAKGLIPLDVQLAQSYTTLKSRMGANMLALVTRQLAILLGAGIPLDEVLLVASKQIDKPAVARILLSVRTSLLQGYSLAASLQQFPNIFSESYCAAILAGEQSGVLEKVLLRLAEHIDEQLVIKQKVQQALIYPSVVCGISMLVVIFLLTTVVPKMVAVFSDSKQQLPGLTLVLIAISNGVKNYWLYGLACMIALAWFIRHQLQKPRLKQRLQDGLLKLPILGYLYKITHITNFLRTLGNLLAASVPVVEALHIASKVVGQISLRQALLRACHVVSEGEALHKAMQQTGFFPPVCLYLIASGENSDQLETMLEKSAYYLEGQLIARINTLLTLFEPLMIVVMGGFVLFIVLAVLLPIFDLNQLVA
jgi:general secretion pathway protein F